MQATSCLEMTPFFLVYILLIISFPESGQTAQLGESCTSNEDCESDTNSTICAWDRPFARLYGYYCCCKPGFVKSRNEKDCLKIGVHVGASCVSDEHCGIDNSICLPGAEVCYCREGFVPSSNRTSCLEIVNGLDGLCKENRQCRLGNPGPLSACTEIREGDDRIYYRCKCMESAIDGKHPKHNVCVSRQPVNGACTTSAQCLDHNGYCLEGKCVADDNK